MSVKQRLLALLDFSVLDDAMDNGPGRNPNYPRSVMTKGVLYAISQNKYSYDAIAQYLRTYPARRLCGFSTEMPVPSTVCRFWERVWEYLPLVVKHVSDVLDACDIYGDIFVINATTLPAPRDDSDVVWAFDEHREDSFYYGCGNHDINNLLHKSVRGWRRARELLREPHRGVSKDKLTPYLRTFQLRRRILRKPGHEALKEIVRTVL